MRDKENILDEEKYNSLEEKQTFSPLGDTEEGNIEMSEEDREKEIGDAGTVEEIIELLNKDVKETFSSKYQDELKAMALKDPTSVKVETPEGWMTIAEATKKGFNPESGQFDGEGVEARIDRIIKEQGLSPEEGARIKAMLMQQEAKKEEEPEGAEIPMGEDGNPIPPEGAPVPEGAVPEGAVPEGAAPEGEQIDPAMLAALGGGA